MAGHARGDIKRGCTFPESMGQWRITPERHHGGVPGGGVVAVQNGDTCAKLAEFGCCRGTDAHSATCDDNGFIIEPNAHGLLPAVAMRGVV